MEHSPSTIRAYSDAFDFADYYPIILRNHSNKEDGKLKNLDVLKKADRKYNKTWHKSIWL